MSRSSWQNYFSSPPEKYDKKHEISEFQSVRACRKLKFWGGPSRLSAMLLNDQDFWQLADQGKDRC